MSDTTTTSRCPTCRGVVDEDGCDRCAFAGVVAARGRALTAQLAETIEAVSTVSRTRAEFLTEAVASGVRPVDLAREMGISKQHLRVMMQRTGKTRSDPTGP